MSEPAQLLPFPQANRRRSPGCAPEAGPGNVVSIAPWAQRREEIIAARRSLQLTEMIVENLRQELAKLELSMRMA